MKRLPPISDGDRVHACGRVGFCRLATARRNEKVIQCRTSPPMPLQPLRPLAPLPATRPEQKQNQHDKSDVFCEEASPPSSPGLNQQNDKGRMEGF